MFPKCGGLRAHEAAVGRGVKIVVPKFGRLSDIIFFLFSNEDLMQYEKVKTLGRPNLYSTF